MSAIRAKFGGDTKEFDSALRRSVENVRRSSRQMEQSIGEVNKSAGKLGQLLKLGGVAGSLAMVTGAFRSLSEHAKDAADAGDEAARSVVGLGEGLDALGLQVKDWGVQALSWFTRVGDSVGDLLVKMSGGPGGKDFVTPRLGTLDSLRELLKLPDKVPALEEGGCVGLRCAAAVGRSPPAANLSPPPAEPARRTTGKR
jgi:hypothetical protein